MNKRPGTGARGGGERNVQYHRRVEESSGSVERCKVHTNYKRVLYVQKQKKVDIWPNIVLLK